MNTKSSNVYDSTDYPYYTYQYWLTPGRIAAIAVGAAVLIVVVLAMIVYACRRRRAAKVTTIFSTQPRTYPAPAWRQNEQSLIDIPNSPGWYHPPSNPPFDSTKSGTPSDRVSRTAPYGEVRRVPTLDQVMVQRPASINEVTRNTVPGQVRRAASPHRVSNAHAPGNRTPGTEQSIPPPRSAELPGAAFAGHSQRTPPPGETLDGSFPNGTQSNASTVRTQATADPRQDQEQMVPPIVPPPRHGYTQASVGAGTVNVGNQSPPPYSPVAFSPHPEP